MPKAAKPVKLEGKKLLGPYGLNTFELAAAERKGVKSGIKVGSKPGVKVGVKIGVKPGK